MSIHRSTRITGPHLVPLRPLVLAVLTACAAALCAPPGALAHVAPLTDRQMVGYSRHVVVATVESQEVRWNPQHTFIMTDYVLSIENRLKGASPARVTLSMPGGALDGETHSTCVSTPLETGGRYLLFLGDLDVPAVNPVMGGWQGVFHEIRSKGGRSYVKAAPGAPAPIEVDGEPVEFETFVEAVREMVREIEASPEPLDEPVWKLDPRLPAKSYDPTAAPPDAEAVAVAVPLSDLPELPRAPLQGLTMEASALLAAAAEDRPAGEKYVIQRFPSAPVVYNPLPSSLAPWAPHDQYAMAYWNVYANNVFRVYSPARGFWAFRNGVFDIVGWPSNEQMAQQFNWTWSSGILGVTFYSTNSGPLVEADIALNPYMRWTLNQVAGTRPDNDVFLAQHTLLHELGHGWGLAHPWETQNVWWDSIMNYVPKQFMLPVLHVDDVYAIRSFRPGTSLRDAGLSVYVTQDSPGNNQAVYNASRPNPPFLYPGSSFTLSGALRLENLGTQNIVDPKIEVYLVPQRLSWTNAIFLRNLQYRFTARPLETWNLSTSSIRIPQSVRPGTYYVGFFIRDSADGYQTNNSAWSIHGATVTVGSSR
jgi:hypothetical protein